MFLKHFSFLIFHKNGFTSLHWACNEGNAQTAEFLISSGAEIDALDKVVIYIGGYVPYGLA